MTQTPNNKKRVTDETVRKDIASGQLRAKSDMIRFCLSPEGVIVPDLEGRLPGKGVWVTADKESIRVAVEKRLFHKAIRRKKLSIPEDLTEKIEILFAKRCQNLLGVARKAGLVVSGFDKVMEALRKGTVFCLLEAKDAGSDAEKIRRASAGMTVYSFFTAQETGDALGRDRCVYVALKKGGASERLIAEIKRATMYANCGAGTSSPSDC